VVLQDSQNFIGWIRVGKQKDVIVQKLNSGAILKGMIESINREFNWEGRGGPCFEGTVSH